MLAQYLTAFTYLVGPKKLGGKKMGGSRKTAKLSTGATATADWDNVDAKLPEPAAEEVAVPDADITSEAGVEAAIKSAKSGAQKSTGRPGFGGGGFGFGAVSGAGDAAGFGSVGRKPAKEYESKAQSNSRYAHQLGMGDARGARFQDGVVVLCRMANAKHISSDDFRDPSEDGGKSPTGPTGARATAWRRRAHARCGQASAPTTTTSSQGQHPSAPTSTTAGIAAAGAGAAAPVVSAKVASVAAVSVGAAGAAEEGGTSPRNPFSAFRS